VTNKCTRWPSVGHGTPSAVAASGAEDSQEVDFEPPALPPKLDRPEEKAAQLYRVADAAQAAVDMLRPKLAKAEAEIDRLRRERTVIAAELYRESQAAQAQAEAQRTWHAALAAAEMGAAAAESAIAAERAELAVERARLTELQRERGEAQRTWHAALAAAEMGAAAAESAIAAKRAELAVERARLTELQRERGERAAALAQIEIEVEDLRARFGERDAALAAAEERAGTAEASVAGVQAELAVERARLIELQRERGERDAALAAAEVRAGAAEAGIIEVQTKLTAQRNDLAVAQQIARELMVASTADIAPQKQNQGGGERSTMLWFGRALRARALKNGDRARDAKLWSLAVRHYRKALARDPLDAATCVQYGHALKEAGHLSEAEAAYRRSLASKPDVADTHLQLGHVLKLQGRTAAAQAAYLRAFAVDPAMPFPRQELAGLGWSASHISQLGGLSETLGIAPLRSLREAADAARDRRDWPTAVRLYGELVTAEPTALHIAVQLGHAHKQMGDLEQAARTYYTVLKTTPSDDDLHLQIGHVEKLRGNLAAAAAHYQKAVEINPGNQDAIREHETLGSRFRAIHPNKGGKTEPHQERGAGGQADRMTDDLRFVDARAGEIYRQLASELS
jgi:Tfp pilus assembly protein PilF